MSGVGDEWEVPQLCSLCPYSSCYDVVQVEV